MPARTSARSECSATRGLYLGPGTGRARRPDPRRDGLLPAGPLRLHALDPPGCPGRRIAGQPGGQRTVVQGAPDRDVEALGAAAQHGDPVPRGRDVIGRGDAVRPRPVDRDVAVPAGRAGERPAAGQVPAHPDGYPGPLHRARRELDGPDREVLARIGERPPGLQARQDGQPLVEEFRPDPGLGWLAEQAELPVGGRAQADAEDHPAATEQVQRGRLLGQLPRPPPWQRGDHRAHPDARGARRHQGQHLPGVHDRRPLPGVGVDQVIPEEEPVETGPFRGNPEPDQLTGVLGEAGQRQPAPHRHGAGHAGMVRVRGPARSTWEGSSRPTMRSASAAAPIMASRSTPVATPMSSTMCTSSSVAMLPVAPGAYGHPPSPPTDASKSSTPSSSAASTLARPVPRVLWKCRFSGVPGNRDRNPPTRSRTRRGVAIPVVSPNETESAPSATARPAAHSTRSTGTSPSYGQPHAVDTITWQAAPRWCASSMTTAISSSDRSVLRLTFLRLCVSEAETTTSTSVNPASRARRAPRRFGASAEYRTVGTRATPAHTSSASAICGIASARTNETASIRVTPVWPSRSISAILAGVGTGSSFCSPSLGPTSRSEMRAGMSLISPLSSPLLIGRADVDYVAGGHRDHPGGGAQLKAARLVHPGRGPGDRFAAGHRHGHLTAKRGAPAGVLLPQPARVRVSGAGLIAPGQVPAGQPRQQFRQQPLARAGRARAASQAGAVHRGLQRQ